MDKTFYSGYILEVKTKNNLGLNTQTARITALEKDQLETLLALCDLFKEGSKFAGNYSHDVEKHFQLNSEILRIPNVGNDRKLLELSVHLIDLKLVFFEEDWTRVVESVKVYYLNSPVTLYDVTEKHKRPITNSECEDGI